MKSFIIFLSKIESSYISALELQKSLEKININAELFEGSYGNIVKDEYIRLGKKRHPWGVKGASRPFSESYRNLENVPPGEIGCFDSHYRLWKKCSTENEPYMIFEDDVKVYREYHAVEWEDVLSIAFSHKNKMALYIDYLESPTGLPHAANYKQATMPGLGGYIIKPHAAKVLVDTFKETFLPADNAVHQDLVKIQLHSYMIGRAKTKREGNISVIRTNIWETK
jgi:GR25 family glycosyltransferase involved in LPS biosynthesis